MNMVLNLKKMVRNIQIPTSVFGHEFTHMVHSTYNDETNALYNSCRGNGQNKVEEMSTIKDANQINIKLGEEQRVDHLIEHLPNEFILLLAIKNRILILLMLIGM